MQNLKDKFEEQIHDSRSRVKTLVKEYGDKIVGEISLRQIYSGMRGMLSMVTETSKLDPNEGIRFRGYSLPELQDVLPRAKGSNQPLPEGMFYLMLIGELPTEDDVKLISSELEKRSHVSDYVFSVINNFFNFILNNLINNFFNNGLMVFNVVELQDYDILVFNNDDAI